MITIASELVDIQKKPYQVKAVVTMLMQWLPSKNRSSDCFRPGFTIIGYLEDLTCFDG